jgi:hypothetical protein
MVYWFVKGQEVALSLTEPVEIKIKWQVLGINLSWLFTQIGIM